MEQQLRRLNGEHGIQILKKLESTLGFHFSSFEKQTVQTIVKAILAKGHAEIEEKEAVQQAGMALRTFST